MKEKIITSVSILGNAILFLILGIVLIVIPTSSLSFFHITISLVIIFFGLIGTIFGLIGKQNVSNIIVSLLMLIIGLFFLENKEDFLLLFPILFAFYIFILGVTKLATFIVYKIYHFSGFIRILLNAILDFLFVYVIMGNPAGSIKSLTYLLALYFILMSLNYLVDFIEEQFPKNALTVRRRFRMTIPNFLSILIPYTVYTQINKLLNKEITDVKINKNVSGKVDLEIFICVKDSVIGAMGHTDLYFENKIYSYGHYDEKSKRLFQSLGDGCLYIVNNKKNYLKFCTEHSKKTIFIFGITLTDKQKQRVRDEISKIKSYTYRWKCDQEQDDSREYDDYASCLYRATNAKFYKFNQSTYRLYFVFWTNCVKLVDNILGATGSDIIRLNGFISPGAYYYHLNNEFKKKNSNVIRKQIVTNTNTTEQKKNDII